MNRAIMDELFPGTSEAVDAGLCPLCRGAIGPFRDPLSKREYKISGLCQECQDKCFDADGAPVDL